MARIDEYEQQDALGLAAWVRAGEVSPCDLLEAAVARVEERNAALNAVVIRAFEEGRKAIDAGLPEGPFRGVPWLLKDLHAAWKGVRLTSGSRFFADNVSDYDTELTARYKRAGLVLFGRTASPEFGGTSTTESILHGATRNPWKPTHSAGGSSGGAAAAVAAGIVPAAHATDGGGSIRIPASCCGLFGMKPTRARVPSGPKLGEGWSGMSVQHAVSRSVRDSAALLDAVSGPAIGDPYDAPPPARPFLAEVGAHPGRLRIAVQVSAFNGAEVDPDCVAAARDAADLCRSLGHDVAEAELLVDRELLARSSGTIIGASLRATLLERAAELGRDVTADDVEPLNWLIAEQIKQTTAADYAAALRGIHRLGREVSRFLERYDVLVTPTMATPPLPLGRLALTRSDFPGLVTDLSRTIGFTQLFNASGHPAMSVPLYWNSAGLPIGVQFAGRFGDEATLFRLAAQLESARPWFLRRPASSN
ncbi:MAG TPA: amidase [Myxococcota bacterium]|nr:amidase [Myxococcota bacterium]